MRFKDFEIVIHGDFESGDDELDLRGAIAKKLGGMNTQSADLEAQTIEKIDNGDARWAPPLQQHLDVVKQSLVGADGRSQNGTTVASLATPGPHNEDQNSTDAPILEQRSAINEINICGRCGHLIIGPRLSESFSARLISSIQSKWAVIAEKYTGGVPSCLQQNKKCQPITHH